jgi:hypothetical protein
MCLLDYFSFWVFSLSIWASEFLLWVFTKIIIMAIMINIPSGIEIPKMIPKLLDDELVAAVGATAATADPLIGNPPKLFPEDIADVIPFATAPTLDALPTERIVSALTDPLVTSFKKHCFLVNFLADASRLELTVSTNHSSN